MAVFNQLQDWFGSACNQSSSTWCQKTSNRFNPKPIWSYGRFVEFWYKSKPWKNLAGVPHHQLSALWTSIIHRSEIELNQPTGKLAAHVRHVRSLRKNSWHLIVAEFHVWNCFIFEGVQVAGCRMIYIHLLVLINYFYLSKCRTTTRRP